MTGVLVRDGRWGVEQLSGGVWTCCMINCGYRTRAEAEADYAVVTWPELFRVVEFPWRTT